MLLDAQKLNRLLGMTCVYSEERNNHPIFSILDVNVQSALYPSMPFVTISFYIFHLPYSHILDFIGSTCHYHKKPMVSA